MTQIAKDKYYTPVHKATYCIEKTIEVLGDKIKSVIEPSAGNGSFSKQMKCVAYDLYPEDDSIIQQDFLTLDLSYKPGRLIIGNPPFGEKRLVLARQFYKKSVTLGDYIAFILPISQLNNSSSMYEFDLVYSENLGNILFSDNVKLHCCFNIYVRPESGQNKKPDNTLKDVTIIRHDSKQYNNVTEDIRICYWGEYCAGKILKEGESYAGEYKIIINNPTVKDVVINMFSTINWRKEIAVISVLRISKSDIYNTLKKYIPQIQ